MDFWSGLVIALAMLLVFGLGVVTRRAIQEQRRAESALVAAQQACETSQQTLKARTAMLGMVSHELRTPLSKILAATELIDLLCDDEEVKQATVELFAAAETMTQQLVDLGAYSQLSYPRASERSAEVDLRSMLARTVHSQDLLAREHRNDVRVDIASEVPYRLAIDAIHFEQIASNLIGNAVKYTRDGTVHVAARLAQDDRSTLEMVVADTGKGIALAEQELIWEPFYRAPGAEEPGTGLGLAIVKLAVIKLGGAVSLKSAPGTGSTFIVRLPAKA